MLCWIIGLKFGDKNQEFDNLDALDYFSAFEHIFYEILKSDSSAALLKDCKLLFTIDI